MSTLYVDNLQPNLGSRVMAAGHVVQTVFHQSSTPRTTTSTTYVDTGEVFSITPTAASSKVLIVVSGFLSSSAISNYAWLQLCRGSTVLVPHSVQLDDTAYSASGHSVGCNYLDSPSSTGQVDYKLQIKSESTGNTAKLSQGSSGSSLVQPLTITLMEIAQ